MRKRLMSISARISRMRMVTKMKNLIHGIQLQMAYDWYIANASEFKSRARWFWAMKRINCLICEGPIDGDRE